MLPVSLRIIDSATNQPTPVRLRVVDLAGQEYMPLGFVLNFTTLRGREVGGHLRLPPLSPTSEGGAAGVKWCYIDGACEIKLPLGRTVIVEATKGPEYYPLRHEVTLGAGQMALRLSVSRWIDLRTEGWHAGDTRCHYLSPHAALREGQAEDLSVVNLLALQRLPNSVSNILAFSGQKPALEIDGCIVAVNTFNTHRVLGKLALLHCHREVFPLNFGAPFDTDDWSLSDWCDQCHRKKGFVIWCEPGVPRAEAAPEALADLILGRIDAVEITPEMTFLNELYDWWSAGIRAVIVGAGAKDSNRTALGSLRTYARMASASFTYSHWIDALRSGNTFVTSGPILEFTVDGQPPGSTLDRLPTDGPLKLRASMRSATPPGPLEILAGGEVIARSDRFAESPYRATLECEYRPAAGTWLAARCVALPCTSGFAHTSSVTVRVGGRSPSNMEIAQRLSTALERTCRWVETKGRFEIPRRKETMLTILRQAQQKLG